MFYKQIGQYNEFYFVCDAEDDIENLPTLNHKVEGYTTPSPGATAIVIDGTRVFMYGNDNEWHEL